MDTNPERVTFEKSKTWAEKKETVYAQEEGEAGRIADLQVAEDMAHLEKVAHDPLLSKKKKGVILEAVDEFESLSEEEARGFTDEQAEMMQTIERLNIEHPNVLLEVNAGKNRLWFVDVEGQPEIYVLGKDGAYQITYNSNRTDLILSASDFDREVLSKLNFSKYILNKGEWINWDLIILKGHGKRFQYDDCIIITKVDIGDAKVFQGVSKSLELADNQKKELKAIRDREAAALKRL